MQVERKNTTVSRGNNFCSFILLTRLENSLSKSPALSFRISFQTCLNT